MKILSNREKNSYYLNYSNLDEKGNPRLYRLSLPFSDYDFLNKRIKKNNVVHHLTEIKRN